MATRRTAAQMAEPTPKASAQTLLGLGLAVVGGTYPPGSSLPPEPALCAEFGVSRTVVREAIKSLVAKRLLSTGPKVGTRVLPVAQWNGFDPDVLAWQAQCGLGRDHLRDLQALRQLVEPAAARLAAEAASAEHLEELDAAWLGLQAAVEQGGDGFAHEQRFRLTLLNASGNAMLAQMGPALALAWRTAFELSLSRPEAPRQSLQTLRQLLDGLKARAPQKAERACAKGVADAQADVDALLATRRRLPAVGAAATKLRAARRV